MKVGRTFFFVLFLWNLRSWPIFRKKRASCFFLCICFIFFFHFPIREEYKGRLTIVVSSVHRLVKASYYIMLSSLLLGRTLRHLFLVQIFKITWGNSFNNILISKFFSHIWCLYVTDIFNIFSHPFKTWNYIMWMLVDLKRYQ